jgi:hypothetical protein
MEVSTQTIAGTDIATQTDDHLSFIRCPITLDIPMLASSLPCGHTFDYEAIFQWLESNAGCPVCRNRADINEIRPNLMIRDIVTNLLTTIDRTVDDVVNVIVATIPDYSAVPPPDNYEPRTVITMAALEAVLNIIEPDEDVPDLILLDYARVSTGFSPPFVAVEENQIVLRTAELNDLATAYLGRDRLVLYLPHFSVNAHSANRTYLLHQVNGHNFSVMTRLGFLFGALHYLSIAKYRVHAGSIATAVQQAIDSQLFVYDLFHTGGHSYILMTIDRNALGIFHHLRRAQRRIAQFANEPVAWRYFDV